MNPYNNFDNVLIRRQQDIWEGHPHWDHPLLNHYHSTFLAYLYNSCHAELSAPDVPSFTLFCHKELASLQILKSCFSSQNLQMIFLFVILFLVKVYLQKWFEQKHLTVALFSIWNSDKFIFEIPIELFSKLFLIF